MEFHATLYGDDAEAMDDLKDDLDDHVIGGVDNNADMLRAMQEITRDAISGR